jgi:sensor histidine kinase YesM
MQFLPMRRLAAITTIALGLAAIEWWSTFALEGHQFGGPVTGAVLFALLAAVAGSRPRFVNTWRAAWGAALTAVVELGLGVALIGSFTAVVVMFLPVSLSRRFLQGDAGADFMFILVALICLATAARAWFKYSVRSVDAAHAALEAERARAEVAERERELAQSELLRLKAQIEPHFLWNTLAHVKYLTSKSPQDAERMTGHLIDFLMSAVPESGRGSTTLATEMASAEAYLAIMKIRMGERLSVSVAMDDDLGEVPFPPLLLQTLVENAIKHGVEPKVGSASISITAHAASEDRRRIVLEVRDDGVGLSPQAPTRGTGLGLNSLRDRLAGHYGSAASLRIMSQASGGVSARIEFPRPEGVH